VYTYDYERSMLQNNILPVCMDMIHHDGTTLPPGVSHKKIAGRPKMKRIRKRSRYAHEPEKSSKKCSRCRKPGHNINTCLAREALGRSQKGTIPDNDVS
jgi:hypothetical protein